MAKYQIEEKLIDSAGNQHPLYPINRDIDTTVSINVYGNSTTATLDTALESLNSKYNNYYLKSTSASKSTSATYASTSKYAINSKTSTYASTANNATSAGKTTFDSNGNVISNLYLTTAKYGSEYKTTTSASNTVAFTRNGAYNLYKDVYNRFSNIYLSTTKVANANVSTYASSAICDSNGNDIIDSYYKLTDIVTNVVSSDRCGTASFSVSTDKSPLITSLSNCLKFASYFMKTEEINLPFVADYSVYDSLQNKIVTYDGKYLNYDPDQFVLFFISIPYDSTGATYNSTLNNYFQVWAHFPGTSATFCIYRDKSHNEDGTDNSKAIKILDNQYNIYLYPLNDSGNTGNKYGFNITALYL